MVRAGVSRPDTRIGFITEFPGSSVSRPRPYYSDEQSKCIRTQRSQPDSADRSATPMPPPATSPDDVLGTTSGDVRALNRQPVAMCAVHKTSSGLVGPGALQSEERSVNQVSIRGIRIPVVLVSQGGPTRRGPSAPGGSLSFGSLPRHWNKKPVATLVHGASRY